MILSDIKNKINCCYADKIYNEYLQNRYGINNCNTITDVVNLNMLKKTFEYYQSTLFCNDKYMINTGKTKLSSGNCSIDKLIEKINLL